MTKHIIKKKELPVAQIKELFLQLSSHLPEWIRSPTLLVTSILNAFNHLTIVFCYFILIGQTARLFVKEQSYANTKVLITKWIIFLFFQLIFSHVSKDNLEGSILKSLFLLSVFCLIYPSKTSKTIFQKYFKGQQMLKESSPMTDSFIVNNNSLLEKLIVVILVQWLKAIKYLLNFINPLHRRTIEDEINEINQILSDQKYFWTAENTQGGKSLNKPGKKQRIKQMARQTISQPLIVGPQDKKMTPPPPQLAQEPGLDFQEMIEKELTKGVMQVMDLQKQNCSEILTSQQNKVKEAVKTTFSVGKKEKTELSQSTPGLHVKSINQSSVLSKQEKYKKYAVSQYLPLFSTTNRSSAYQNLPNKRCTYYREVEISYDVNSAVMTVTSLEDMKVSYHELEEIIMLEDLMIQFQFEDKEQMMVKFKNRNEFEEFISSIDIYESSLQSK